MFKESQPFTDKNPLTEKDHQLIRKQCEIQQATSRSEIAGFTKAYSVAKTFASQEDLSRLKVTDVLGLVDKLSKLTDPVKNKHGYRVVPVTFASGDRAIEHSTIERTMRNWAECYSDARLDPTELYREFERIHPYNDGNGRVGDLMWKIAVKRQNGNWPEELPPDLFGKQKSNLSKYISAFGEVE